MSSKQILILAREHLSRVCIPEALRLFHLAEKAGGDPDSCAAGRWTCHMLAGNFELAWQESDAIASRENEDPNRFWDGRPLRGRSVLMRCLHGLGDTIQFIRYAPLIRRQARWLTIEAQPTMKSLIQDAGIADQVITWGEQEPYWDQQIEVIELPRIFRTTVNSIPDHIPYLDVPSAPTICPYDGSRTLRIGIVWASSVYNPARSISLQEMAGLFTAPEVSFFSLQAGPERTQLQPWSNRIASLYDGSDCVKEMARNLKTLDLVITVDTMMAHLAGALGRPVWTLLPYECDWRWMVGREDSPWYPTMRLFRQPRPGDWKTVIQRIRCALDKLLFTALKGRLDYQSRHSGAGSVVREA